MTVTINGSGTVTGLTKTGISAQPVFPGNVIQVVNFQTGAVATGTTAIPIDDTIPQNTEGTEFMTLAITPTSATSKLLIEVIAFHSLPSANWFVGALFQNSIANALASQAVYVTTNTAGDILNLSHYMTAGTTSLTTFKYRAGRNGGGTIDFNGLGGARIFGGVVASSITITEIAA